MFRKKCWLTVKVFVKFDGNSTIEHRIIACVCIRGTCDAKKQRHIRLRRLRDHKYIVILAFAL